jgi:glycosyltransferase involved in cell wall biosynthesis
VTRPWLSVIVPSFNGAQYLRRALESVAAEADDGVEVIAIDDGSTDATLDILKQFRPRLNLAVIQRRAGNWAANSNHALRLATGEYACFLHQDDAWRPGRQAALRRQLARTPQTALLLHACEFVDPNDRPLGPWRCPYPARIALPPRRAVEHLLVQNFVGMPGAVFRRDAAVASGGLDESLWYTADWDLWLKLAAIGPTVYLPEIFGAFRLHPASQTADRSRSLDDFRTQMELIMLRHAADWAEHSPPRKAARASVEVNVALAAAYHRQPIAWRRTAAALGDLSLADWRRFLRDSRLSERVLSRIRGGFARRTTAAPSN